MLGKEVTVSEMWVTCMLHNWCTDVYAQYGPWFSLPITAWSSFFSSSRSTLLSFLPRTSHSSSILFKRLLWVGTPWLLFLCPLQAGVVFVCVCDPRPTRLRWMGWRIAFEGGWHWSRDGSCFLCLSCPSACLAHPLLLVGLFCLSLSMPALPTAPGTCSWALCMQPFILALGLVLYSYCLLAAYCLEQLCLG